MKTKKFFTVMMFMSIFGTSTMLGGNKPNGNQMRNGRNDNKQEMVMNNNKQNSGKQNQYNIKGYEDRVKHENGYWSYYRDGRWYNYDHFIEPSTYYSTSLSKIGTGIVIGTVIGSIISSLIN